MSHLVLGGTGTVGGALVRELLARGEPVRVLTRSAGRAGDLPEGAEAVVGDLLDPRTYPAVFDGARTLFLLNAVSQTELHEGLAGVVEARRAGVERVVYLSVQDADRVPFAPHFAAKVAVEAALRASGVPFTILRPNSFNQNDLWFREAIQEYGVYPQPIGSAGVSRVDVRDIARAAANALTRPGHEGRTYVLAGPQALTGDDVARTWAEALGRDVRYGGDDLDAWERQALQVLPAWMAWDFKLMYAAFLEGGLAATAEQLAEMEDVLGGPPRPFRDFARETAAAWGASG